MYEAVRLIMLLHLLKSRRKKEACKLFGFPGCFITCFESTEDTFQILEPCMMKMVSSVISIYWY
jgi:hypothetical protein